LEEIYTAYRRDTGEAVPFAIEWPTAEQAEQTWSWDPQHNPFPTTPFSASFGQRGPMAPVGGGGGNIVAHGYRYSSRGGGGGGGGGRRRSDWDIAEAAPRLTELWDRGWRLQIDREAREIATRDYGAMSLSELWPYLASLPETAARHSDLMFRALDLITYWRNALTDFCLEHFPGQDVEELINRLLEGELSPSTESANSLWDIAQRIASQPAARAIVSTPDPDSITRLVTVEGGANVASALLQWLDRYGRRNGSFGEIGEPTLMEEPLVVQSLLRGYMTTPDPKVHQQRLVSRRDALIERLGSTLNDADRRRFEELAEWSRRYVPVKEDRNYITAVSRGCMREPILAAGRKLVDAGVLAQPDDIFYLTLPEIEAVIQNQSDQTAIVGERRADLDYWRNVVPPGSIGGGRAEEPAAGAASLKGVGVSAGVARGVARVIMTIEDAHRLQPGEVLVTRTTTSTWTPLFHTAAAVVVDGGSMLSHAAVVAREFQLPAVVGLPGTRLIPDGAVVTVDGGSGLVVIDRD
jgi:phosphohistidine swiveling domain-containing protein